MNIKSFFIASIVFFNVVFARYTQLVLVTPTYNNERWCIKNIESVVSQSYKNWRMIIIDDCSTDQTRKLIEEYIIQHNLSGKISVISNPVRQGALKNIYLAVHSCKDNEVIVLYDGDDWFLHEKALTRIAQEYKDTDTWMTYGSWQGYPNTQYPCNCRALNPRVIKQRKFRESVYVSSHPRTFYAWLFKEIDLEDLLYKGEFFPTTWDLAIMFPLLEMASKGHIRFIPDYLYVYNMDNPLNDYKVHADLQQLLDKFIRSKDKYKAL